MRDAEWRLEGLQVTDAADVNSILSVTLIPERGQIDVAGPVGVTRTGNDLVLTGTVSEINQALGSLVFKGDEGQLAGKLTVRASDGDPTTLDPTGKITVDLLYPTEISLPNLTEVLAGTTVGLGDIVISDQENDLRGIPVTLTLTPVNGSLAVAAAGTTRVQSLEGGVLQLEGLVNDLNQTLQSLSLTSGNRVKEAGVRIEADDHFEYTANTVEVLRVAVSSAPEQTLPLDRLDVISGQATLVPGIQVSDYDSGQLTVRLTTADGVLTFPQQISVTLTQPDATTWQLTGAPERLNQSLGALRYSGDTGQASGVMTVETRDGSALTPVARGQIELRHVVQPGVAVPATDAVLLKGVETEIPGITVTGAAGTALTLTLRSTGGSLNVAAGTGVQVETVDANTLRLNGKPASLNAALETLQVTGETAGTFNLDMTLDDAEAVTLEASAEWSLDVLDTPRLDIPGTISVASQSETGVAGIRVSDADSSSLRITLIPDQGTLILNQTSGVRVDDAERGGYSLQGSAENLNEVLDHLGFVSDVGARETGLSVVLSDGDARTDDAEARLTFRVVTERPPEAGGDVTLSGLDGEPIADNARPEAANLRLIPERADPDGPLPEALKILDVTGGTLRQADGSPLVTGLDGTVLALSGDNVALRFQPDENRSEPAYFNYVMVDSAIANLYSPSSRVTVPIVRVNDAPVVAQSLADHQGIKEGEPFRYVIPAATFSDSDSGDRLTLSAALADGEALPTELRFDAATGILNGTPGSDQAGTYEVVVTATDAGGLSVSAPLMLRVAAVVDSVSLELPAAYDSGESDQDQVTNLTRFPLEGRTDPGKPVILYGSDGQVLGRVTSDDQGYWSVAEIDSRGLVNDAGLKGLDGDYTFSVNVTGADGAVEASNNLTVHVDATPPSTPLTLAAENERKPVNEAETAAEVMEIAAPILDVTLPIGNDADVEAGYILKVVYTDANRAEILVGQSVLGARDVAAGRVTVECMELDDGFYSLDARLYDQAGNFKHDASLDLEILIDQDGVLPSVESMIPPLFHTAF